ncbi:MAG: MBL fold metallo-hydrolase [Deltaproteobacteria bacterium]|nr:MBL fold metallo-hydrolase [Deltaproteobacteria bacterium]
MTTDVNRREFLKATVAAGTVLMAGDLIAAPDGRREAARIPELDSIVVTVITDNYYDALRPDAPVTKRYRVLPGTSMHAEHGLSYFIETVSAGRATGFMFDYGLDGGGVNRNMALLGIDLGKAAGFGLSHGHFDHWSGLKDVLELNRSKIRKGTPLFVGPEVFERRYSLVPGTTNRMDIGKLNRAELESLDVVRVSEVTSPTEVLPGGYLTGPIARVTDYEKPNPTLLVEKEGAAVVDSFPGEQAMVFNLKGKGLVVLSSCAHSGIVNTIRQAQSMTGVEKVHAVIGGFHLINAKPEVIQRTVADIKAIQPAIIVPAHCTGFEAITLFAREMPGQFILNTAGTRYTFSA